jgi:hypothetical protein
VPSADKRKGEGEEVTKKRERKKDNQGNGIQA